ncbi:Late embryogenesis abundant protein, LEA-14 [Corchorus capsularis]|uniref:Late embryogenesis abundant protein, LEA-14 n=1 Tax=Corchorus capsularis TaxID=210143 RepID=A0A1R3I2C7_COCAP|nr:Late embryogenesis abundant protein, LEA-14 [Corchorus capsularis]
MSNNDRLPIRYTQQEHQPQTQPGPPPQQPLKRHHTARYYAHRVRESFTTRVTKIICAVFLSLLLVVGIAFFILWLSLRPHRPRFHIEEFTVPGLAQPEGFENAQITFNVTARNSNQHIGIYYDSMVGSVYYRDQQIGSRPLLDPFYQEPKTTTVVYGTFGGATLTVNSNRWKEFMNDRQQSTVLFRLEITSVITFWGLMLFLLWLILAPKQPIYKVVDVYMISHSDGSNSTVGDSKDHSTFIGGSSSNFDQNISIILNIQISNPNKKIGINHDDIKVSLYNTDNFVGNNSVAGLLALCLWLAVRPRSPNYTIQNFSVPAINDSNASDSGIIQYELNIDNPNQDSGIYYDDISLIFYHGDDIVGNSTISAFYQGRNRNRQVLDHVSVKNDLWTALRNAIVNATAELRVDLSTRVKYKTWGIKSKHHGLRREGKVPIGKDGKISNKKKKVKLRRPSKKWKLKATRKYI